MAEGELVSSEGTIAAPIPVVTEKMIPQSKVDEIVHERTRAVAEKVRREAQEEHHRQQPQQSASMGGIQQTSQEDIRRMIAEESQKLANQQIAQKTLNEFASKMSTGKSKYSDFDETMSSVNFSAIPDIVDLANQQSNTAEVMYDLVKNASKIANLQVLNITNPKLAQREMQKLSASIAENEKATQVKSAREPLSQLPPSTVGTDDGPLTLKDLRKQPWMKA